MRSMMQKVIYWVAFVAGCFLVAFIKAHVENTYHPNEWLMAIGGGLIVAFCSHLADKFPNFFTRAIRWLTDKWA